MAKEMICIFKGFKAHKQLSRRVAAYLGVASPFHLATLTILTTPMSSKAIVAAVTRDASFRVLGSSFAANSVKRLFDL